MKDKLLIRQLNRGSQEALCGIYEKYRDDLVRIAAGLLNNVSAAEDIVQDVFLMLVRCCQTQRRNAGDTTSTESSVTARQQILQFP